MAIKNALLDAKVDVTNTLGALNPAAAAVANKIVGLDQQSLKSKRGRKGASTKERVCLPAVQTREEMKAASDRLLAKKFPKPVQKKTDGGKAKGRKGSVLNSSNHAAATEDDAVAAAGTNSIRAA